MSTIYRPGACPTLLTVDGIVLVAAAPDVDLLAGLGELAAEPLTPMAVVRTLARGDLALLPDLAAVRRDGALLRTLVRGAVEVRVDGAVVADGRGAGSWQEGAHPVAAGSVVEVVPHQGGVPDTAAWPFLPVGEGIVLSAGVHRAPAATAAPPPAVPTAAPVDEMTSVRPRAAAPAAAHPAPAAPSAPAPVAAPPAPVPIAPVVEDADHDGRTMTLAQLQALRAGSAATAAPAPPVAPAPVPGADLPAARPQVALALSTGRVVPVRRRVLIGRSPRIQQVGGSANLPALVTVDDPYVSGTHVEVRVEGLRITVTDLSTNGTLLTRPGGAPDQLEPGTATEIALGDVLTLSKGLTVTLVPTTEQP